LIGFGAARTAHRCLQIQLNYSLSIFGEYGESAFLNDIFMKVLWNVLQGGLANSTLVPGYVLDMAAIIYKTGETLLNGGTLNECKG